MRIGSQLLANWLKHGVVSHQELEDSFARMARVVDEQNIAEGGAGYTKLADNLDGPAYRTALNLVLEGEQAANGYVEDALNAGRRTVKAVGLSSADAP